jgi:hypothetical protein
MLLQGRNNRLHSQYLLQQNLTLHYYSAHSPLGLFSDRLHQVFRLHVLMLLT